MDWLLDQLLPAHDFRTRFTRRIAAEPAQVWAALFLVTYDELPVTRLLLTARSGGRAGLTGPVLQTMPLTVLGRREDREAVIGRVAKFWLARPVPGPASTTLPEGFAAFTEPGWAKAAMSFQLSPVHGGQTLLAAETRVRATDAAARRAEDHSRCGAREDKDAASQSSVWARAGRYRAGRPRVVRRAFERREALGGTPRERPRMN